MSSKGYPTKNSCSLAHQLAFSTIDTDYSRIDGVFSIGTVTRASSSLCASQTVTSTILVVPTQRIRDSPLVSSVNPRAWSPSSISSPTISLDGKATWSTLDTLNTSSKGPSFSTFILLTNKVLRESHGTESLRPAKSAKTTLKRSTQNTQLQTILDPPPCGNPSPYVASQTLSIPSITPSPTTTISLPTSTSPGSMKPTVEAAMSADSHHSAVAIGLAIGVPCILLLVVLAAAACCLWPKFRFRRRRQDGLSRRDSAATTLTAGSASISNASSATVVEAPEPRVAQASRTRTRGMRTHESYEMDNLGPSYSAGGFLSSI